MDSTTFACFLYFEAFRNDDHQTWERVPGRKKAVSHFWKNIDGLDNLWQELPILKSTAKTLILTKHKNFALHLADASAELSCYARCQKNRTCQPTLGERQGPRSLPGLPHVD